MGIITDNSDQQLGKFKTKPFDHQLVCLNKHGRSQTFALLAEQGTGKTWIIINNAADLWASGDCDALFVLAPNGVHTNWTRLEFPRHMPDWVRWRAADWVTNGNKKEQAAIESLYDDTAGGLRVLTMNWEALQTKKGFAAAERFCRCSRRLMIACDESDSAKNPKALRTKALMKLKKYSYWRRIMTGTMINNSPFDAFSQYSFLDESILGTTSYYAFKAEYAEMLPEDDYLLGHIIGKKIKMDYGSQEMIKANIHEIFLILKANGRQTLTDVGLAMLQANESGNYKGILSCNEQLRQMFAPGVSSKKSRCLFLMAENDQCLAGHLRRVATAMSPGRLPQIVEQDKKTGRPKYRNLDKLSALIAPHSFRVLKKDCLDLPDKIYKTLFFDLTKEQKIVYKKAEDECRIVFEGEETPFAKLVAVTKLAQITSGYYIHPLADEPVRIKGENPKLDLLAERVNKIVEAEEKVIIWARYRIEIEDIVQRLKAEGHNCAQYHGGINKVDRTTAIENFEHGSVSVFVGNQKAGGTGITLIAASYVIYFSNDFSLRARLQSEDRAHRIGQTKNVTYINIVGKDTIDEVVTYALLNKQDVAETIVDKGFKLLENNCSVL